MTILDPRADFIPWHRPIDPDVRAGLLSFFSELTSRHTVTGNTFSLRSLLQRHLDAPVAAFLGSVYRNSAAGVVPPISQWKTKRDMQIDKTIAELMRYLPDDDRTRATADALMDLGYILNGAGTSKSAPPPLTSIEYCECCEMYSSRYRSVLETKLFMGRQALIHPVLPLEDPAVGSRRLCDSCGSQQAYESKSYQKRKYGADRGQIRFAKLLAEASPSTDEHGDVTRIPELFGSSFHDSWPWTKRTMARLIASGVRVGASSTRARMRRLEERSAQQNEFIVELFRSILPECDVLPEWLLLRTGDFAQVELTMMPRRSTQELALTGYARSETKRCRLRFNDPSIAMAKAKEVRSLLCKRLGIDSRNWIELELPHLDVHVQAEYAEIATPIKPRSWAWKLKTAAPETVPPAFRESVRRRLSEPVVNHWHFRLICQVERAFQYEWLLDYLESRS